MGIQGEAWPEYQQDDDKKDAGRQGSVSLNIQPWPGGEGEDPPVFGVLDKEIIVYLQK